MDWQSLVTSSVVISAAIAAAAFVAKSLISQWMARNIEAFKATLTVEHTRFVEELRANLQLEAQRHQIVFGSLHARRAEIIAELYGKLDELDRAIHIVLSQQWFREIREETDRRFGPEKEPFEIRPGYEVLSTSEQKAVDSLASIARDFYQFYGRNRIYFSPEACDLLYRFGSISFFFAGNYHNIAYKDKDGKPYVNPEVKRVWDEAIKSMPQLKDLLEREFRSLLGVTSATPPR
jgi:hypothetical protein